MRATAPSRHPLSDRKDDFYETPLEATRALLKCERLPPRIWEPACGRGAIAEQLKRAGHEVFATDLVSYGYGGSGVDFLMERRNHGCDAIITNPPFKLANEFVRHALALCPKVIMLLRLAFLESEGRADILDSGRLARVHIFRNRLPLMHRDGWAGKRSTNSQAFAWFVWDAKRGGPTALHRLSWEGQRGADNLLQLRSPTQRQTDIEQADGLFQLRGNESQQDSPN